MDDGRSISKAVLINRILALCLVLGLAFHWRLVTMVFQTAPWTPLGVVVLVLFVLWIGSVVGLLRMTRRGYYFTYALVPFATVFHGIALVPGITELLPSQQRPGAVLVLNLLFLSAAGVSHRLMKGSREPMVPGRGG